MDFSFNQENKDVESTVPEEALTDAVYAGFWKRFFAFCIDVIMVPVLQSPFFLIAFIYVKGDPGLYQHPLFFVASLITGIYCFLVPWLYFAILESSKWQATLGKKLLGLKVIDISGNRIGFWRMTLKLLLQFLVFQIPLIVVGVFIQLLGLLSSIVIAIPFYLFLFTNSKRQTLFDLIVRRAVIDTKAEKKSVKTFTIPLWSMVLVYLVGITVLGVMFSNFISGNSKKWIASGMPEVGQIVVADRDIAEGETIGPLDAVECPVPPDIVSSGSFVCSNPVIGSKTARPVPRGDWFIVDTLEDGSAILKTQSEQLQENRNNPSAVCIHESSKARKKIIHRLEGKDLFLRVVHDIPEGEVIKAEDIAVESLDENKVPVDSMMCRSKYSAVGKCAKHGIAKGQMLSSYDINYEKLASDRACFAKTPIKAGTAISGDQIEYKTITAEECPSSAVVVKEVILNKKALHDIKAGDILRSVDVLDEFQVQ